MEEISSTNYVAVMTIAEWSLTVLPTTTDHYYMANGHLVLLCLAVIAQEIEWYLCWRVNEDMINLNTLNSCQQL